MGSSAMVKMMNCHECGRPIEEESHFCQYCGHELPGEEQKKEDERETAGLERPDLPIIGGVFIIISSLSIFFTIWLVLNQRNATSQEWIGALLANWPDWYLGLLGIFGVIGII